MIESSGRILYSRAEASTRTGIPKQVISRLAAENKLELVWVGRKTFITEESIDSLAFEFEERRKLRVKEWTYSGCF